MQHNNIQKIRNIIWSKVFNNNDLLFYAILDSARDESIFAKLVTSEIEQLCLYNKEQSLDLAEVAPYIVLLHKEDSFTKWFFDKGWGRSWGILFSSSASLFELKKHFEQFITVSDEKGNILFFRFYDPRVLRVFLPTCNNEQLSDIFDLIRCFYLEGEDNSLVNQYSFKDDQLNHHQFPTYE